MATNRDQNHEGCKAGPGWHRRFRVLGVIALSLGVAGFLASFPFIYGDPAPGQAAATTKWFEPVGGVLLLFIALGEAFLAAPLVHRFFARHRKSQPTRVG